MNLEHSALQGQLSKYFKRKIAIIFLPISLNMCHRDGSFEHLQHMV